MGFMVLARMAIAPEGKTIACVSSSEIAIVDAQSGERLGLLSNLSTSANTLSFDQTGERLVIGGDARTAFVDQS